METNTKRLTLLLRGIDLVLLLIVASVVISFLYASPYVSKFSNLADNLPGPSSGGFDPLKWLLKSITYIYLLPIIVRCLLYGFVLYQIRKVVKSILDGGAFRADQAARIRKIAYYFLGLACLILFFKLIFTLIALERGNMKIFTASLLSLVGIFERYVLTGLICLGIAEVFISGMKIKEDQDLTI